jgi:cobalamin-dependent methionine synthase I
LLIVGERINTSRVVKNINVVEAAVVKRDAKYISQLAIDQYNAGADYIDLNCGTLYHGEPEAMVWLVETVQNAITGPLSLDSPNPAALKAGLQVCDFSRGKPIVNSISAEKERYNLILPLVIEYKAKVVALAMDDTGIQQDPAIRLKIATELVDNLIIAGVMADDIYIDPLTFPIATRNDAATGSLKLITEIREKFPNIHIIAGISNTSHGMPERKYLNSAMAVLAMDHGLDAAIIDPNDELMMYMIKSASALLGKDKSCTEYLSFCREMRL